MPEVEIDSAEYRAYFDSLKALDLTGLAFGYDVAEQLSA